MSSMVLRLAVTWWVLSMLSDRQHLIHTTIEGGQHEIRKEQKGNGRQGPRSMYGGTGFMVEEMILRQRFLSACSEST